MVCSRYQLREHHFPVIVQATLLSWQYSIFQKWHLEKEDFPYRLSLGPNLVFLSCLTDPPGIRFSY